MKSSYPYNGEKITQYDSVEEMKEDGFIKSDYKCPNCGKYCDPMGAIGQTPVITTFDKYPDKDVDMGYVWEEGHICASCETKYWIENGT